MSDYAGTPKDFAKIVRSSDGHQVLLLRSDMEPDEDGNSFELSIETDMGFFTGKTSVMYPTEEVRDKLFDAADTAMADKFRAGFAKLAADLKGEDE